MGKWVKRFWVGIFFLTFFLAACGSLLGDPPPDELPTPILALDMPIATPSGRFAEAPPTPLPPLPTATETAVSHPTPTYNPQIAEWTILVYLDADNNLEGPGLLDMAEMEAAGASEAVNVVVQIDRALGETDADGDWSETRRYLIQGGGVETAVSAQPLASLGERNMGDPQTLADFISWGMRQYPANRTALIVWDHGAGWNGIAFDDDTANLGAADHISLPDLRGALDAALSQSNMPKLDVIGFDACLMGQLDVFQAVQPYANYVVGSEELTPGLGWDYTTLLSHLYDAPTMDGEQLSRQMVADFMQYYTTTSPDDFVTMTAVNLTQLPQLTQAVEELAHRITAVSAAASSAVGDARSGAASFARVYADAYEQYAAIDLHHFSSILAQRSPDAQVNERAAAVVTAIENAVIAHEQAAGIKDSHGIAIYFPRNGDFYDVAYREITQLPVWDQFLTTYHAVGLSNLPAPEIHITNVLRQQISVQNPAYIDFEIVGRAIENVALIGARWEDNGRLRLLEYDNLVPEPTFLRDGSQIVEWRDGVHEDFYVWRPAATYLYDSFENGDFVVMWPTEFGSPLFTAQGRFRRANGADWVDANLVFDNRTGELTRIWSYQSDSRDGVAEILPQSGDLFQLYTLYLEEDQTISREPGPELFFDAANALYFDRRPLPDGGYSFGFSVQNVGGETAVSFIDLNIDNSDLLDGYTAYLDPYLGFQFLYPNDWYTPVYTGTLLHTSQRDGNSELQITIYPNLDESVDATTLKAQTLAQFGAVDLLFEDELLVAGISGARTAYGYADEKGPHTGSFFTFIHEAGENRTGFVVDLDGLEADEAATVTAIAQISDSWQFAPAGFGLQPGQWATVDFDTFSVAQPADFVYQEFNGWQRFGSGQFVFVALRTQTVSTDLDSTMTQLLQEAGAGVAGFTADESFLFALGEAIWQRVDFAYTLDDGTEIWGYLMVRFEEGQAVVAWVEAPATAYNRLETAVFLTMIADLEL